MDAAHLIKWMVTASLLLMVFGMGLRATFADATSLFRDFFRSPHRLVRSLVSMNLIVPAIAVAIALLFDLPRPVKIALLAMAVSPVPPILPGKQMKFGGNVSYVYGLLVAISLVAIVVVPLSVELLGWTFGRDLHVGPGVIAQAIGMSILLPLVAGLVVRKLAPGVAERLAPWVTKIGTVLLVIGAALILWNAFPAIVRLVGSGAILAFAALAVIALAVGHLLGGPDPHDRTVLAIASTMRHPGVAIAIAHTTYPDDRLAPAAVLLFLLIGVVVTTIYGKLTTGNSNRDVDASGPTKAR
jgi:BASS family bile acid:Na+ symporter